MSNAEAWEHDAVTDSSAPLNLGSVVVPAHNEERAIPRLLNALTGNPRLGALDIVVVCNGCTDGTAAVARGFPGVRVVESPIASKREALRVGDEEASGFPRVYVDADVVIDASSLREMLGALEDGVLATAPERSLDLSGVGLLVRWYYEVWERLPQVRAGLFGRGVIAVSRVGHDRVRSLPPVMSDDLVLSEAFAASERRVVPGAQVRIYPPRTIRDLLRRRVRVVTGNNQADQQGLRRDEAKTSWVDLGQMVVQRPSLALRMPVFVAVTVLARLAAMRAVRRGDFSTWLRDESSRS